MTIVSSTDEAIRSGRKSDWKHSNESLILLMTNSLIANVLLMKVTIRFEKIAN